MTEYIIEWSGIGGHLARLLNGSVPLVLWPKKIREERRREEIVRCRDCKYLCDDGSTWGCGWHCSCLTTNDGTPPDGFCAWAERQEP